MEMKYNCINSDLLKKKRENKLWSGEKEEYNQNNDGLECVKFTLNLKMYQIEFDQNLTDT